MPDETKHVNLRVPISLHRQAIELAERDHRSLNSYILSLLERAVREADRKPR